MSSRYVIAAALAVLIPGVAAAQARVETAESDAGPQAVERAVPRSAPSPAPSPAPAPAPARAQAQERQARPAPPTRSESSRREPERSQQNESRSQEQAQPRAARPAPPPIAAPTPGDSTATNRAVPRDTRPRPPIVGGGGSTVIVQRPPAYTYYYPQRYYPYGYGGFGLGYFYYDPYTWYPGGYNGFTYSPYGYPGRTISRFDTGELRIDVSPRFAQVFVDGYYAGTVDDFDGTFQALRLEEGRYQISIVAPGYAPLEFNVQIQRGRKITYRGDLIRP